METVPGSRVDLDVSALGDTIGAVLNTIVVPRPIAWISTRSAAGVDNLAPHSYFTIASTQPPVVQFTSIGLKDTLRNVRETGEFVVNVTTRDLASAANVTSTNVPPEQSEFEAVDLEREPSTIVRPPRVRASPVALECRVIDERAFPASTVVFGEVVHIAVHADVLRDGRVAIDRLDPVARLGNADWTTLGDVFELRRPRYRPG